MADKTIAAACSESAAEAATPIFLDRRGEFSHLITHKKNHGTFFVVFIFSSKATEIFFLISKIPAA